MSANATRQTRAETDRGRAHKYRRVLRANGAWAASSASGHKLQAIAASIDVGGNLTLQAIGPGTWGNNIWYGIAPGSTTIGVPGLGRGPPTVQATGFRLRLAYWTDPPADKDLYDPFEDFRKQPRPEWMEVYDDLSIDPKSADFSKKRLTDSTNSPISALASLVPADPQKPIQMPTNTPLTGVLFKKGKVEMMGLSPFQRPTSKGRWMPQ